MGMSLLLSQDCQLPQSTYLSFYLAFLSLYRILEPLAAEPELGNGIISHAKCNSHLRSCSGESRIKNKPVFYRIHLYSIRLYLYDISLLFIFLYDISYSNINLKESPQTLLARLTTDPQMCQCDRHTHRQWGSYGNFH